MYPFLRRGNRQQYVLLFAEKLGNYKLLPKIPHPTKDTILLNTMHTSGLLQALPKQTGCESDGRLYRGA